MSRQFLRYANQELADKCEIWSQFNFPSSWLIPGTKTPLLLLASIIACAESRPDTPLKSVKTNMKRLAGSTAQRRADTACGAAAYGFQLPIVCHPLAALAPHAYM